MSVAVIVFFILTFVVYKSVNYRKNWKKPNKVFPSDWRLILLQKVPFYNALTAIERKNFEYRILEFLMNCRITGIQLEVDDTDRLLIASSAIIPIFQFPNWKYSNLYEVMLFPSTFNTEFKTSGPGRNILGMVGNGHMNGKMALSKPALHHGFSNETDKKNTAIHEFVHLIDKMDGLIDGVPSALLDKQYAIPWLSFIDEKIEDIYKKRSDINPYGGTNKQEFFAVASEYFFERPQLLAVKHPVLYDILRDVFKEDMVARKLEMKKFSLGRNSPCPCGSEKKFKVCCGKVHYSKLL